MSFEEQLSGPARRLLAFDGRDVTLVNKAAATDDQGNVIRDDYGDITYDVTRINTEAELEFPGSPRFEQRVIGSDVDIDAMIFVRSDIDVYTGDESDERGPTDVHDDRTGAVYRVRSYFVEDNGKLRLHCTR